MDGPELLLMCLNDCIFSSFMLCLSTCLSNEQIGSWLLIRLTNLYKTREFSMMINFTSLNVLSRPLLFFNSNSKCIINPSFLQMTKEKSGWLFYNQEPPAGAPDWRKSPCVPTASYHKSLKMRMQKANSVHNAFGAEPHRDISIAIL